MSNCRAVLALVFLVIVPVFVILLTRRAVEKYGLKPDDDRSGACGGW